MISNLDKENALDLVYQARKAMDDLQDLKGQQGTIEADIRIVNKEMAALQRKITQAVADAVDKVREEILSDYEDEIAAIRNQLKKAQSKKEEALKKGITARIAEETAPVKEQIGHCKMDIRDMFKENGVPLYCSSFLYKVFSKPSSLKELIVLIGCLFVWIGVLPLGICVMLSWQNTWLAGITYLMVIVLGVFLYGGIVVYPKRKYQGFLAEANEIYKEIYQYKKDIRQKSREIRKTVNEEHYDLSEYDEEIHSQLDVLEQTQRRKEAALQIFEEETKAALSEAVRSRHQAELMQLENQMKTLEDRKEELLTRIKAQEQVITVDYENALGAGFVTEERLDVIMDLLESGEASTLAEAKDQLLANEEKNS